jgi:aryl-alcohol dehydrogenase-like predicted oxidoreductase
MKYRKLGKSGLDVSALCLGCMGFGSPDRGSYAWALDYEDAKPLVRHAIDLGFNFFDTANWYSGGTSEEVTGRLLREFARRDEIVLATKLFFPVGEARPNRSGLSRKAIMQEIDDSLCRLKTDYVDLYIVHRFDYDTPIEETMEALHDIVKAGKARYLGASSMAAWQFARMQHTADLHGWTRFVSMQNYVNLLYREEEREMLPLCVADGIGVTPWSPLARGMLGRPWHVSTERSMADEKNPMRRAHGDEADRAVVSRLEEVAARHGSPMAQVALAWLMARPGISAPIIGATRNLHLDDAVAALDINLSDEEMKLLEEPYTPHRIIGYL